MHDAEFTKFIKPKVVTRSIVYTTYHANRKKKEEREKSQNEKTAYITRHELPPPEPAMSSIDAESPVDYNNQTFVVPKQKNEEEKHNKTVFIPKDPVQHQESFSYENYKTHHKTENSNHNESFSYQNYKNHHPQQNKQPIEKPKRTYTSLERELISKEALITQQKHEIDRLDRLVRETNKSKTNQTTTKDSKPVPSNQNQAKSSNPAPVAQSKNQAAASSSNTGGQNQSNPNPNSTNQTIKK